MAWMRRALRPLAVVLVLAGAAAAFGLLPVMPGRPVLADANRLATRANRPSPAGQAELSMLPEFRGIAGWVNSEPVTLEALRGKVVLVQFLSYSCVNVIRTLPYLKQWHEKYASSGLVVLGIHSPQWGFEEDQANVRQALERLGVTWPVALDDSYATWDAYGNRYWPTLYLADKTGRVRYRHVGEGEYRSTERRIRQLLREAGAEVSSLVYATQRSGQPTDAPITRELYAGRDFAAGQYLGNSPWKEEAGVWFYEPPGQREDGKLYFSGAWEQAAAFATPLAPGNGRGSYTVLQYKAAGVNTVAAPRDGYSVDAVVELDGDPVPRELAGGDIAYDEMGQSFIRVDTPRMYNLVRDKSIEEHRLKLSVYSGEFRLYTFAFTPD